MEPDFTVRSYDLGNKPKPEAEIRYRIRLYEGGKLIDEWYTTENPRRLSHPSEVEFGGINIVGGTVLIERIEKELKPQ